MKNDNVSSYGKMLSNYCELFASAHLDTACKYHKLESWWKLSSVIFAIVVLVLISSKIIPDFNIFYTDYTVEQRKITILLGLATVVTSTIHILAQYEKRAYENSIAAVGYENLGRKIQRQILSGQFKDEQLHAANKELKYLSKFKQGLPADKIPKS